MYPSLKKEGFALSARSFFARTDFCFAYFDFLACYGFGFRFVCFGCFAYCFGFA